MRQGGLSRVCHYSRARLFLVVFCFGGRSKAGAWGSLRGVLFQVLPQNTKQTTKKTPIQTPRRNPGRRSIIISSTYINVFFHVAAIPEIPSWSPEKSPIQETCHPGGHVSCRNRLWEPSTPKQKLPNLSGVVTDALRFRPNLRKRTLFEKRGLELAPLRARRSLLRFGEATA